MLENNGLKGNDTMFEHINAITPTKELQMRWIELDDKSSQRYYSHDRVAEYVREIDHISFELGNRGELKQLRPVQIPKEALLG